METDDEQSYDPNAWRQKTKRKKNKSEKNNDGKKKRKKKSKRKESKEEEEEEEDDDEDDIDNPINIKFQCDLITDAYSISYSDNLFIIFTSIFNELILVYSSKDNTIIFFSIKDNIKISEIINAHPDYITNFRHHTDKINDRDLILSISGKSNNLKVWDFNKCECLYEFEKVNKNGYLNSACFITVKKSIYVITSHYKFSPPPEPIKVFNIKGRKKMNIDNSNFSTVFIDTYYDRKLEKIFIITGNYNFVRAYDYDENTLYKKFNDHDLKYHDSVIINDNGKRVKLIESSGDGNVRIWDFHDGDMLKKIQINKAGVYGICLWSQKYLFVGCKKTIKLLDIKDQKKIKTYGGHENEVLSIKKIFHPKYHDCLLSFDRDNFSIKLWAF
jgi:WD40 repeat protein